jgi:hypothetical protein
MSDTRTCPHCGQRVYETDQVCLSCGQDLAAAAPPVAGPRPAAGEPPRPRPDLRVPWTARITDAFGDQWELYPKIVLGGLVLVVLLQYVHAPVLLLALVAIPWFLSYLGLYVWAVVDNISTEAERYWFWIIFLFHGLGMVAYFIWGR